MLNPPKLKSPVQINPLLLDHPKIDFDFWGNLPRLILSGAARRGRGHFCDASSPFIPLWRGTGGGYGEEQKCADNEVWQASA